MASLSEAITGALTAGIVSSMDPMNGVIKQMAAQQLEQGEVAVISAKLELVKQLSADITRAHENNDVPAVKNALEKLMSRLTASASR